jgi:hypothetical protein
MLKNSPSQMAPSIPKILEKFKFLSPLKSRYILLRLEAESKSLATAWACDFATAIQVICWLQSIRL